MVLLPAFSSLDLLSLLNLSPAPFSSTFFPADQTTSFYLSPAPYSVCFQPSAFLFCSDLPWPSVLRSPITPCLDLPLWSAHLLMNSLATVFQVTPTPGRIYEWQPLGHTAYQTGVPAQLPSHDGSSITPVCSLPGPTSHGPAHRPGPPRPRPCQPHTFLLPSG